MGWSSSKKAYEVMNKWETHCRNQTKSSNVFFDKGVKFFFETSRKEHSDGSITGTVYKYIDEFRVVKSSSFKINGDGTIKTAPKSLKQL
jgi:hypothetical protein